MARRPFFPPSSSGSRPGCAAKRRSGPAATTRRPQPPFPGSVSRATFQVRPRSSLFASAGRPEASRPETKSASRAPSPAGARMPFRGGCRFRTRSSPVSGSTTSRRLRAQELRSDSSSRHSSVSSAPSGTVAVRPSGSVEPRVQLRPLSRVNQVGAGRGHCSLWPMMTARPGPSTVSPTVMPSSPVTSGNGDSAGRQRRAPLSRTATPCSHRASVHCASRANPEPSAAKPRLWDQPGRPGADGIRGGGTPAVGLADGATERPASRPPADPLSHADSGRNRNRTRNSCALGSRNPMTPRSAITSSD